MIIIILCNKVCMLVEFVESTARLLNLAIVHPAGFEPARTRCPVHLKCTPLDHSGTDAPLFQNKHSYITILRKVVGAL